MTTQDDGDASTGGIARLVIPDEQAPSTSSVEDEGQSERGVVCPICHVRDDHERALVDDVVRDAAPDIARALCPRHLWLAARRGLRASAIAPAFDALPAQLDATVARSRPSTGRRAPCSVCSTLEAEETQAVAANPDATLLCLPHLALALQNQAPEAWGALVGGFVKAGRSLEAELSEMIRKADYRFRDEPRGDERDSWLRALARMAGSPGARAWHARDGGDGGRRS